MAAVLPLAAQLDIADIADAIASDPSAVALLGASFLELAGGTMSGDIELDSNKLRLDADLDTFIDSTVDDQIDFWAGGAVELRLTAASLSAMSKPITNVTDPSGAQDAATKNYTDTTFLPLAGGTLSGNLNISGSNDLIVSGEGFFANGSAANPSITFTSDDDTGIWWSGANAMDFATGSINRFRMESDGTLSAQTASYEALVTSDQDMTNKKYVDDGLAVHTGDATVHFTEGSISHVNIQDIGSNSHATIDTHLADGSIHATLNDAGTGLTEVWSASKLDADLDGKVDVGGDTMTGELLMEADIRMDNGSTTQLFLANGTLMDPALAFDTDANTGVWWPGANIFEIVTDSLARFRVAANGLLTARTASYESLVFGNADALPNLAYIDANYLNLGGGTLSGALEVSAGGLDVSGGNLDVSAANLNVTLGNILVSAGNITATAGIVNGQSVTSDTSMTAVGGVTAGTWFRGGEGSAAVPTFAFTVGGTTGVYQNNSNELDFSTNGLARFTIGSDGTLEVNTATYEALVTDDDDVPNKKYVDDADALKADLASPVFTGVPVLPTYTLGTLPAQTAGGVIFVSDATGASLTGSQCFSNGAVWIDVTTGAAVA